MAKPGVTALFVKKDGLAFPEGTIGKHLSALWEKSGIRPDRISHTDMRKFISTKTDKNAQESSPTIQKAMSHSAQTAKQSYVRTQLTKTASQAIDIIKVTSKPTEESEKTAEESKEEGQEVGKEEDRQSVASWAASEDSSLQGFRKRWNAEDSKIIKGRYGKLSKCPTKSTLRSLFVEEDYLRELMDRESFDRCYEKINVIKSSSKK